MRRKWSAEEKVMTFVGLVMLFFITAFAVGAAFLIGVSIHLLVS